jgi:cell division septation protein DedD
VTGQRIHPRSKEEIKKKEEPTRLPKIVSDPQLQHGSNISLSATTTAVTPHHPPTSRSQEFKATKKAKEPTKEPKKHKKKGNSFGVTLVTCLEAEDEEMEGIPERAADLMDYIELNCISGNMERN